MDILKTAIDWAKAELFSTSFIMLFGLLFIAASLGFWQLGKTEIAKAYIIPTLVTGILLLAVGFGLFYTNKLRITQFEVAYNKDVSEFVASEITRAEATLKEYDTIVFKVIPVIIIVASLLILFINTPTWRAINITTIAMLTIIMAVDGAAYARIDSYHKKLQSSPQENK